MFPINTKNLTINPQTHLILFHTEGEPYDKLDDLTSESLYIQSRAQHTFTSVKRYSPRVLSANDSTWNETIQDRRDWMKNHPDFNEGLLWNEKWAALNFLLWKPRLILDELLSEQISFGDILFYHDANLLRYPDYKKGIEKWPIYIKRELRKFDILLFDDNHTDIREDTKHEVIDRYLGVIEQKLHHIWAGAIAVRKTYYSISFIQEWLNMCLDINNISQITKDSNYSDFFWHSVDQAVLSTLYHKWRNENKTDNINCIFLNNTRIIPPPSSFLFGLKQYINRKMKRINNDS